MATRIIRETLATSTLDILSSKSYELEGVKYILDDPEVDVILESKSLPRNMRKREGPRVRVTYDSVLSSIRAVENPTVVISVNSLIQGDSFQRGNDSLECVLCCSTDLFLAMEQAGRFYDVFKIKRDNNFNNNFVICRCTLFRGADQQIIKPRPITIVLMTMPNAKLLGIQPPISVLEKRFHRVFNELHREELNNLVIPVLGGGSLSNALNNVAESILKELWGDVVISVADENEHDIFKQVMKGVLVAEPVPGPEPEQ